MKNYLCYQCGDIDGGSYNTVYNDNVAGAGAAAATIADAIHHHHHHVQCTYYDVVVRPIPKCNTNTRVQRHIHTTHNAKLSQLKIL